MAALTVLWVADPAGAGIKYRSDTQSLPDDNSPALEVFCPPDTRVIGGGTSTTGSSEDLEVSSTQPFDLDLDMIPNDGWSGRASNSSASGSTLKVDAICATSGTFKYRSFDQPLPDLDAEIAVAKCPKGRRVTGGGVLISGGNASIEVSSTKPIDTGDRDSKPDDAWFGRATNRSGGKETMTVFAICGTGSYTYRSDPLRLSDNTQGTNTVRCPQGTRVTGGGVGLNRPSGSDVFGIEVSDTFPRDLGTDGNPVPDDAWGGGANNDDTGEFLTMTTFAICD